MANGYFKVVGCSYGWLGTIRQFWVQKKFGIQNLGLKHFRPKKVLCPKKLVQNFLLKEDGVKNGQIIPGQMFPGQMSPGQLESVKDGPRNLLLMSGQNQISNSWDIPDKDKCRQDKGCIDKCDLTVWICSRCSQEPTFKVWSKLAQ